MYLSLSETFFGCPADTKSTSTLVDKIECWNEIKHCRTVDK